jgi:hypothetical protein
MKIETSKKLCMFFALTNLGLWAAGSLLLPVAYNGIWLNLYVGIAMVAWVLFLDLMPRQK